MENIENFLENTMPVPESGCWIWLKALNPFGYGMSYREGRTIGSHRYSWELHNGPIPKDKWVLHKCDVRACVNPSHLYLGSPKENMRDKFQRKRENTKFWDKNCRNGHVRTEQNTLLRANGKRSCKVCLAEKLEKYRKDGEFKSGGKYYAGKYRKES